MRIKRSLILLGFVIALSGSLLKIGVASPEKTIRQEDRKTPDYLIVNTSGKFGGKIVSCFLNDPKSFHPLLTDDLESQVRNQLINPGLVRINLVTQLPEPELAKSWETSSDQLRWTFHLRRGLKWSDGTPFDANDVIFTLQVVHDPAFANTAKDALTVDSKPIQWKLIDPYTVIAELPSAYAPFLRKLDGTTLPIIPKHKWEESFKTGKLLESLSTNMDLRNSVSLGAFVLKDYHPGESLQLKRNPNYWKVDKSGHQLPYLDEIIFLIISNLDQVQLKIESGEIDTFYSVRAQDIAAIENKSSSTGTRVYKLGPTYGYEGLFFNQNGARNPKTGKSFVEPMKYSWFTDVNFRKAVSYSIDREAMVKNALFGMGLPSYGPESASNLFWYNDKITKYPLNREKAIHLLGQSGFHINAIEGKPVLFDVKGNQVRFSLYTNAGNTIRNQESLIIVSDLAKIGMQVDYSPLEFKELVSRITSSYDYDAILLGKTHEIEPADGVNAWLSSSSSHFWYPNQTNPNTPWQKRIDELVKLQNKVFNKTERKRYYDEIQEILSDQLPMIFTVNEMVIVTAKEKIGNLKPSVSRHRTLWNSEELYWKQ